MVWGGFWRSGSDLRNYRSTRANAVADFCEWDTMSAPRKEVNRRARSSRFGRATSIAVPVFYPTLETEPRLTYCKHWSSFTRCTGTASGPMSGVSWPINRHNPLGSRRRPAGRGSRAINKDWCGDHYSASSIVALRLAGDLLPMLFQPFDRLREPVVELVDLVVAFRELVLEVLDLAAACSSAENMDLFSQWMSDERITFIEDTAEHFVEWTTVKRPALPTRIDRDRVDVISVDTDDAGLVVIKDVGRRSTNSSRPTIATTRRVTMAIARTMAETTTRTRIRSPTSSNDVLFD